MKLKPWTGLAFVLAALSAPAAATLGEDAGSVLVDQAQMQAVTETSRGAKFVVHKLQLPSGTAVREYVSYAGTVFAVAWQGPAMPDLRQLLGRYFETYTEAMKQQGAGFGSRGIQQPGLVVQTAGHMRAYFGRAYVPPLLPPGVAEAEIE